MKKSDVSKFSAGRVAVATIIVTCLFGVFLHLSRVSSTEIKMELSISEINFTLPQKQVVTNIMKLSSIGASGLENVQVPGVRTLAGGETGGPSSAVLLSIDTSNSHSGAVTLDALSLPAGMRIGIRHTDVTGEYRFFFHGKAIDLPVQVDGYVKMILPPNPPEVINSTSPGFIKLQAGENGVDLDLSLQTASNRIFPGVIAVDSVSLSRINEHHDDESSTVRTVSTILSGTMYYESLDGRKQLLLPGQQIRFKKSRGTINTLELFNDHIALTFVGTVSGMTTGDINNRASLMPTYLEWLNSRVSLPLLVVVVLLLVFGIAFGLWRLRSASN